MIRLVEFEDGSIGKVLHMYDINAQETFVRTEATSIVVELADGSVIPGDVADPDGIHTVH